MTIAGAAGFRGAATLANARGLPAVGTNLLNNFESPSLLDVARSRPNNSKFNIGTSGRSRQLRKQLANSAAATGNQLLSLGVGTTSSVDALATKIKALRAQAERYSVKNQSDLPDTIAELQAAIDNANSAQDGIAASSLGRNTNTVI